MALLGTGFCGALTSYSSFMVQTHERGVRLGSVTVVLTVVLALSRPGVTPYSGPIAITIVIMAVVLIPTRLKSAATIHRMPEYASLVAGSRTMAERHQPLRTVETAFPVLPTVDTEVVYLILGGTLDRSSPWVGVIEAGGAVRRAGHQSLPAISPPAPAAPRPASHAGRVEPIFRREGPARASGPA